MSKPVHSLLLISSRPEEQEKFAHFLTLAGYHVTGVSRIQSTPTQPGHVGYDAIVFAPTLGSGSLQMDCLLILRAYFDTPLLLWVPESMPGKEISAGLESGAVDFIRANTEMDEVKLRLDKAILEHTLRSNEQNLRRELILRNMDLEEILKKRTFYLKESVTQIRHHYEENSRLFRWLTAENQTRTLGTMTSDLTHIFNNMLQVILGHLAILKQRGTQDGIPQTSLTALSNAAEQAAKVIKHLIGYIQVSKQSTQHININHLMHSCLALYQSIVRDKFLIHIDLEEKIPFLHGNRSNLQFVIMNLLLLFKKVIPPHETMKIRTHYTEQSPQEGWIALEFICPIPSDIPINDLFPTDPTAATENDIHAAIIHKIMDENKGRITLQEDSSGRMCYKLEFPAVFHQRDADSHFILSKEQNSTLLRTIPSSN